MAFCPQCNAPQIRVNVDDDAVTPPLPPGTPGQLQPPAEPVSLSAGGGQPRPGPIQWRHAFPATLTAGIVLAIYWALPWVTPCLWGLAGGALAVVLYQRRQHTTVTPGAGARLGVVTGLLGFVAFLGILSLQRNFIRERWTELQQAAAQNPNPAVRDAMQKLSTPEGQTMLLAMFVILALASFLVFSAIGGAIGAALFGRREK